MWSDKRGPTVYKHIHGAYYSSLNDAMNIIRTV